MKTLINVVFALLIISLKAYCQEPGDTSLVGIWKGKIITTDKHLPYEIIISNNDGKLTGYSYTTYTVNAVEMVAVRTMKIKNDNGNIVTEDDDLLFDSFDKSSPKQIKQTNTLVLKNEGESLSLNGGFVTKKTRDFRSLSGNIELSKEKEIKPTPLLVKLDELKLLPTVSFIKPVEEERILVKKIISTEKITAKVTRKQMVYVSRPPLKGVEVAYNFPPPPEVAKAEPKPPPKTTPPPATKLPEAKETAKVPKPVPVKPAVAKPAPPVAAKPAAVPPPVVKATPPPIPVKTATTATAPSFTAALAKREIETIQTVNFKTDSLLLTLYDNGTVDGDTVSVILDGKMIMAKQGLSTNALSKTIYLPPGSGDSMQLVMYAENLGSLPPNTGLLIIRDGADRYEIRFSGNLEKNAAIILKRRRNE